MEARLEKRREMLVRSHLKPLTKTSAGVKNVLKGSSSLKQTQAAWRFFNNAKCTFKDLAKPLLDAANIEIDVQCKSYGLVVHDWSNLTYNRHKTKKNVYHTIKAAKGYQLQSSLLISDKNGEPIAPIASNLKTSNRLLSSYKNRHSRKLTNLEELVIRTSWINNQFPKKELVHIVDREGDSVDFFREMKDKKWLVRVKANNRVKFQDKVYKIEDICSKLTSFSSRKIKRNKENLIQKIYEAEVFITRPAKPKRNGKALPEKPGRAINARLIISKMYKENGELFSIWYLLSNQTNVCSETLAKWYYWRWSIETFFKTLKSSGLNIEQWRQEKPVGIFRRLLVSSMACVFIWKLANDERLEAQKFRLLLIRLSGRQMRNGVLFTKTALLAGIWAFLSVKELMDEYGPIKLESLVHDAYQKFLVV